VIYINLSNLVILAMACKLESEKTHLSEQKVNVEEKKGIR